MKLIIAGSRNIHNFGLVVDAINIAVLYLWDTHRGYSGIQEIVSGAANGADKLGERFANEWGIPVKKFPADWGKYGKSAGPKRNVEMAEYGTHLVAVWDGKSRGTQHMFNTMRDKGKPVYIHLI